MTQHTITTDDGEQTFDIDNDDERETFADLIQLFEESSKTYSVKPPINLSAWDRLARHVEQTADEPQANPVADGGNEIVAQTGIEGRKAFQKLQLNMVVSGEVVKVGETNKPGAYELVRTSEKCPGADR